MKYIIMLGMAFLLSSCLKSNEPILDYRGINPAVIIPNSNFPSMTVFPTRAIDSVFGVTTLNLTAKYAFQVPAPRDISVTFTRDDALMATYNQTFGNTYLPLPADCYVMPTSQAVIKAGLQVGVLPVTLIPSKISGNSNYVIAFTVTNAEDVNIANNFKSIVYTLKGK